MLLVIPQNELSEANEMLLASLSSKAEARGISLVIKRYGMKAVEKETGGEETGGEETGGVSEPAADTTSAAADKVSTPADTASAAAE